MLPLHMSSSKHDSFFLLLLSPGSWGRLQVSAETLLVPLSVELSLSQAADAASEGQNGCDNTGWSHSHSIADALWNEENQTWTSGFYFKVIPQAPLCFCSCGLFSVIPCSFFIHRERTFVDVSTEIDAIFSLAYYILHQRCKGYWSPGWRNTTWNEENWK